MAAKRHGSAGWGPRLTVFFAVAAALWLAGPVCTGRDKDKELRPQKITPQGLDALARQYREAGLPLPPEDAPLLLVQAGVSNPGGITWSVGFRIGPGGTDDSSGRVLLGTETGDARQVDGRSPATRPLDPDKELTAALQTQGAGRTRPIRSRSTIGWRSPSSATCAATTGWRSNSSLAG